MTIALCIYGYLAIGVFIGTGTYAFAYRRWYEDTGEDALLEFGTMLMWPLYLVHLLSLLRGGR